MVCRPDVESRFLGLLLRERDHHLVVRRGTEGLDAGIMNAGPVGRLTNSVRVRRLRKLDIDQRASAKIDAQVDVVPEKNREDARHAEDQRKSEEVPLLP